MSTTEQAPREFTTYTDMEEGDWAKLAQDNLGARIIKVSDTVAAVVVGREKWRDEDIKATVEYQLAQAKAEREVRENREARNNKLVEVERLVYDKATKTSSLEKIKAKQFDLDFIDWMGSDSLDWVDFPQWGESADGQIDGLNPHRTIWIGLEGDTFSFALSGNKRVNGSWEVDESAKAEFRFDIKQVEKLVEYFQTCMEKMKAASTPAEAPTTA